MFLNVKRERWLKISEHAYLWALFAFFLYSFETDNTTFNIPWPEAASIVLLAITAVIATLRYAIYQLDNRDHWKRNLIVVVVSLVAFGANFLIPGDYFYDSVLFLAYFAIGAIGIDFKKICRCYLWGIGPAFVITVLACLSSSINDIVFWYSRGAGYLIRSSMGTVYPTECGTAIFFLILVLYVYYKKLPGWIFAVISLAGALFCWTFCNARNDTGLLILFLLLSLLLYIYQHHYNQSKWLTRAWRIFGYTVSFTAPIAAVVELILVELYCKYPQNSILCTFNNISNCRIEYAASAFEKYGVKIFGTYFDIFSISGNTNVYELGYNMIDFSYIHILICFGPVILFLILAGMVFASIRATQKNDFRIVLAVMLVALHSILDYNLSELSKNAFLLLPYCMLEQNMQPEVELRNNELPAKKIFACMILPIIGVIFANQIISTLRTFAQINQLTGGGIPSLIFGLILGGILFLIVLFDVGLCKIIDSDRSGIKKIIISIIILGSTICYLLFNINRVNPSYTEYEEVLADEQCMTLLDTYGGDKAIYCTEFPNVYRKFYGIGNSTWMDTENLARLKTSTIIVDKDYDSNALFGNGYLYTKISKYHALYTNDQEVMSLLIQNGYEFTEYARISETIDNVYMSELNGLPLDEDGSIEVEPMGSISKGPYITAKSGKFVLRYELSADPIEISSCTPNKPIAQIEVVGLDDQLGEFVEKVYSTDFDSTGNAVVEVPFESLGRENVEFILVNSEQCLIKVKCIKYRKVG